MLFHGVVLSQAQEQLYLYLNFLYLFVCLFVCLLACVFLPYI